MLVVFRQNLVLGAVVSGDSDLELSNTLGRNKLALRLAKELGVKVRLGTYPLFLLPNRC